MSKSKKKRIAICTGGGDAPGLNAVIKASAHAAIKRGWECWGIRDGYNGLLMPEKYPDGGVVLLDSQKVRGITHLGGTILGTTNRGNPTKFPVQNKKGEWVEKDRSDYLIRQFKKHGFEALIAIGGDGSLTIAHELAKRGNLSVVGVPKTIDNDLQHTVVTFGFDSAVSFATECLDRLHSTAEAHQRVMIVEVMGRYAGWIALHSGIAGSADAILIPEIPYDIDKIAQLVNRREELGKHYTIIVVAEGAVPVGGTRSVVSKEIGQAERLGGVGERIAHQLSQKTMKETRCVVLGHLLRGGSPTTNDRLISLRFGAAAVRALAEGRSGIMVALDPPDVRYVPLEKVAGRMKKVPLTGDTVLTAREIGIEFGD